jgi:small subunit ribosomal protein S18
VEQERPRPRREDEGAEEEGDDRGRGMIRRARVCQFCAEKNKRIDYKNVDVLRGLISDRGKIRPRRQTGTCARHQREVSEAVKRARHMALLPFAGEMPR